MNMALEPLVYGGSAKARLVYQPYLRQSSHHLPARQYTFRKLYRFPTQCQILDQALPPLAHPHLLLLLREKIFIDFRLNPYTPSLLPISQKTFYTRDKT